MLREGDLDKALFELIYFILDYRSAMEDFLDDAREPILVLFVNCYLAFVYSL